MYLILECPLLLEFIQFKFYLYCTSYHTKAVQSVLHKTWNIKMCRRYFLLLLYINHQHWLDVNMKSGELCLWIIVIWMKPSSRSPVFKKHFWSVDYREPSVCSGRVCFGRKWLHMYIFESLLQLIICWVTQKGHSDIWHIMTYNVLIYACFCTWFWLHFHLEQKTR